MELKYKILKLNFFVSIPSIHWTKLLIKHNPFQCFPRPSSTLLKEAGESNLGLVFSDLSVSVSTPQLVVGTLRKLGGPIHTQQIYYSCDPLGKKGNKVSVCWRYKVERYNAVICQEVMEFDAAWYYYYKELLK